MRTSLRVWLLPSFDLDGFRDCFSVILVYSHADARADCCSAGSHLESCGYLHRELNSVREYLSPHPAARPATGEAYHVHLRTSRPQFLNVVQMAIDYPFVQSPHQVRFGVPAGDAEEAGPSRRLHIGTIEERVENDIRPTWRQAGYHFATHFVHRRTTLLCLGPLFTTEVGDEPLQVGCRGGAGLDGKPQPRHGIDGGHEERRGNQGLRRDDLVDAPSSGNDAHLPRLIHTRA